MDILKIKKEEQLLIKYFVIKNLIILKIKNTMDINEDLLQWFLTVFDENISCRAVKNETMSNK